MKTDFAVSFFFYSCKASAFSFREAFFFLLPFVCSSNIFLFHVNIRKMYILPAFRIYGAYFTVFHLISTSTRNIISSSINFSTLDFPRCRTFRLKMFFIISDNCIDIYVDVKFSVWQKKFGWTSRALCTYISLLKRLVLYNCFYIVLEHIHIT